MGVAIVLFQAGVKAEFFAALRPKFSSGLTPFSTAFPPRHSGVNPMLAIWKAALVIELAHSSDPLKSHPVSSDVWLAPVRYSVFLIMRSREIS